MKFNATPEQQSAIETRGNILVSAAAGSGKTAVLVERVIDMLTDTENPVDANRLLIVTFTNAAAAEMRIRIEKRLWEECGANPSNLRLLKQKHLIASAKICTIDSFCIDLIRENFETAGVSPDFKMGTGNELGSIMSEVYSQMINEYLEEYGEDFRDLLDITGCEYDEENFIAVCKELFLYSQQMPFPKQFLDGLIKPYTQEFDSSHPWFSFATDYAVKQTEETLNSLAVALEFARQLGFEETYAPMLIDMAEQIRTINDAAKNLQWDEVCDAVYSYSRLRAPSVKANNSSSVAVIKDIYSQADATIDELRKMFAFSVDEVKEQISRLKNPAHLLIKFIKEFSERTFKRQCEENIFTFYNTEQMALQLLCENINGEVVIKESALPILEAFDEILVDEYQDTNDLQDMLFKILSSKGSHLFVVGDVKQSIYGFRGANPNNFLNKKNSAVSLGNATKDDMQKIILSKNFRSKKDICDYINFFFKNIMNEQTGSIIYDESEELVNGAKFPEYETTASNLFAIDLSEYEDAKQIGRIRFEARQIASYIRSVMAEGKCIRDKDNTLRAAKYSDFAILLRFTKNSAALAESLKEEGIPVTFSQEEFFETVEISNFLALLEIINNPDNDIPLLTAMMSPVFAFTAEDLARMRTQKKRGSLLSAVTFCAKNGNIKAQKFLQTLDDFRRMCATESLPRFMSLLLNKTNYSNIVLAMEDGERKRANLQILVGYATDYVKNSSGGLGGFLNYINSLTDDKITAAKTLSGGDSVRIMSMHMSKGLQFPVCILADTVSSMHNKGGYSNCVHSDKYGIGFRYFEESIGKKTDTLGRMVISAQLRQERMQEELRLLYVALTRAEERLAMVCCEDNLKKKLPSLAAKAVACSTGVSSNAFYSANSMSDWILLVSLLHKNAENLRNLSGIRIENDGDDCVFKVSINEETEVERKAENPYDMQEDIKDELYDAVKQNLEYKYPYSALYDIEAKTTVSALANKAEQERFAFSATPDFMQKSGLSATGRGTATHKFMQLLNLSKNIDIDDEIERLVEMRYISDREAEALDKAALKQFVEGPLYARMLNAQEVRREMRFLTEIPASVVKSELPKEMQEETVMVQGAVDLCFVEDGAVVIVDFKTDRVESEKELIDAYSEQVEIYAKACSKIFDLPVSQKIIYSLTLGKEIIL